MTQIAIPDELADRITCSAAEHGCSREQLVESVLNHGLSLLSETDLIVAVPGTASDVRSHIREGLERANRGDVVSSEEVDRWFGDLFQELDTR